MMADGLRSYISGWLQHKRTQKAGYERLWCTLKGHVINGELVAAYFLCFKDPNNNADNNYVSSSNIDVLDHLVLLHSVKGDKPKKCEFTISAGDTLYRFIADDKKTREKWIYAMVDRVGRCLPPSELPSVNNHIVSTSLAMFKPRKRSKLPLLNRTQSAPQVTSAHCQNNGSNCENWIDWVAWRGAGSSEEVRLQLEQLNAPQSLFTIEWYHGPISRQESINKLLNQPIGTYLLRNCTCDFGSFTLSVKTLDGIKHHKIARIGDEKYQLEDIGRVFGTPQEVVEFYVTCKSKDIYKPTPLLLHIPNVFNDTTSSATQRDYTGRITTPHSAPPFTNSNQFHEKRNYKIPSAPPLITSSHPNQFHEKRNYKMPLRRTTTTHARLPSRTRLTHQDSIEEGAYECEDTPVDHTLTTRHTISIQPNTDTRLNKDDFYLDLGDDEEKEKLYYNQEIIDNQPPPIPPRQKNPERLICSNRYTVMPVDV